MSDSADILSRVQEDGTLTLSALFPGNENAGKRDSIKSTSKLRTDDDHVLRFALMPIEGTDETEVIAIAAVARDPGLTQDYVDAIQDYLPTAGKAQLQKIRQFKQIYYTEGMVNNAVNKVAAIMSSGGRFVVRTAKKGKMQNAQIKLQAMLDEWCLNVNNAPLDGVVTGSRGLPALTQQATRQALIEGDWFARAIWTTHQVGTFGEFDMPMTIQSITGEQIQPAVEVAGTGMEYFYWVPPNSLLQQIQKPTNKDLGDAIKRFVNDSNILKQLRTQQKALLDPALMLHVKHRGQDSEQWGRSFVEPALYALAYKRSVEALDFVTQESLINRLSIVQVGCGDNPKLSDPKVAARRAALMQQFFADPGPNMTIIWQGDDLKVIDVGAHASVLNTDGRHSIAEEKVKMSMGLPDALMVGTTGDGKASGWAAAIGTAAEVEELRNSLTVAYQTLGERMAIENGFQQYDIGFEFNNSVLMDKSEEWNQGRQDYVSGLSSIKRYLSSRGVDPDAEFVQMCEEKGLDPGSTTWQDAFSVPIGLPGQAPGGIQGQGPGKTPGGGRTPDSTQGKPEETTHTPPTTVENK